MCHFGTDSYNEVSPRYHQLNQAFVIDHRCDKFKAFLNVQGQVIMVQPLGISFQNMWNLNSVLCSSVALHSPESYQTNGSMTCLRSTQVDAEARAQKQKEPASCWFPIWTSASLTRISR